jgi:AbrB family looped-hinge helix DNA binding protein
MSIVTSKGQATIPKHIRDLLEIVPGETEVDFVVVGDRVELVNKQNVNPFAQMRGITKDKLSTDQIMAITRG